MAPLPSTTESEPFSVHEVTTDDCTTGRRDRGWGSGKRVGGFVSVSPERFHVWTSRQENGF